MPRSSYSHNQINGNLAVRVDLTLPNFEDGYAPPPLHLSYNSQCKSQWSNMSFELAEGWTLSAIPLLTEARAKHIPPITHGHSCLATCDADGFITIYYQCVDTETYRATPGELSRLIWKKDESFVWREQKPDGSIIEYALDGNDASRALPRWIRVDMDVIELAFSQYDSGNNTYHHVELTYLHAGKGYPVVLQRTASGWTLTDWNNEVTTLHVTSGKLTKVEDTRTGTLSELGYNAQGLTSLTDPDGCTTSFGYSASADEEHFGELAWFCDAESHTTDLTFDLVNGTSSLTNALTAAWQYQHDGQVLTRIADPGPHNGVSNFEYAMTAADYEGEHYLLQEQDPNGTYGAYWNYQHVYDGYGNRAQVTDGENVTTYYWYNDDRKVIGTRVGPGAPDDPSPNPGNPAPGNPNPQPTELGPYTLYQYGEVQQTMPGDYGAYGGEGGDWRTNPNYGGYRPLLRIRHIVSGEYQTIYEYDMYGRVKAEIDPKGNTTHYEYYRLDATYYRKRITDPLGNQTSFDYDGEGDPRREFDPVGSPTLTDYDKRHLPVLSTNPFGDTRSMDYDQRGNLLHQTNERGYTTEHEYDGLSRNTLTRFPLELAADQRAVTQNHYDPAGNTDWTEDANLHTTNYEYYPTNWLQLTRDADNNEVENFYDRGGRLTRVEDPTDDPTEHEYDKADRLTKTKVLVEGNWIERAVLRYDDVGRQKEVDNGRKFTTKQDYDRVNRLRVVTHPISDVKGSLTTEYDFDPNGNQTAVKDANDKVSRSEYDELNRLQWSENQLQQRTNYQYEYITSAPWDANFQGRKVTVTDPKQNPPTVQYFDCLGRLVRVQDANLKWTIFEYDENGNRAAVRDPEENWTYFGYDEFDRLIWVAQPTKTPTTNPETLPKAEEHEYKKGGNLKATSTPRAEAASPPAMNKTEFEYDDIDRRTKVKRTLGAQTITWETQYNDATNTRKEIDPLLIATEYQHDPLDRLRYVKWTEGGVQKKTEYRYDEADNRVAQVDAKLNQTSWEYDPMDRMTKEIDAAGNTRQFTVDGVGNVIGRVDAEGRITNYERDESGNETARIYAGYEIQGGDRVDTIYDDAGNRKKVLTPLGAWEWTYDSLNRMIGRAEPPIGISDPNYGQLVTLWYYDDNGNLTRLQGPDGGITDYEYDERNLMTKVIRKDTENDPNPRVTTYDYYENNLLKLKTLPNGCEAYHEYDELDRLTLLVNRKSDQTVISSFAIEYLNDDNKSKITREGGTVVDYDYDDQKRLAMEKWTASGGAVLHDFTYSYDAAGNRLTKNYNGVTTEYDYNNLNQLTEEQTGSDVTSYGYDKEGNTVRKTEPAKETTYSWNHENVLTKAEFSDATPSNEFKYDGDSVRVEKTDTEGKKQYHSDGLHDILERSGETVLRVFIHGEEQIHGVGGLLLAEDGGSDVSYSLEPIGHLGELTDVNENVVTDLEYDAFGTRPAGEGDPHTGHGFVGKERDDDLGLWAFRARVYDPVTGRFMSLDPIRSTGSRYPYAENAPLFLVDPFGLAGQRLERAKKEILLRIDRHERSRGLGEIWRQREWIQQVSIRAGVPPELIAADLMANLNEVEQLHFTGLEEVLESIMVRKWRGKRLWQYTGHDEPSIGPVQVNPSVAIHFGVFGTRNPDVVTYGLLDLRFAIRAKAELYSGIVRDTRRAIKKYEFTDGTILRWQRLQPCWSRAQMEWLVFTVDHLDKHLTEPVKDRHWRPHAEPALWFTSPVEGKGRGFGRNMKPAADNSLVRDVLSEYSWFHDIGLFKGYPSPDLKAFQSETNDID